MKIIECPRDAMQGIPQFIPTETKVAYINHLLEVGFDTIDFGSFVSPKAIPQMSDTREVLAGLNLNGSHSKLLAIVANDRGVDSVLEHDEIQYLGFPLSLSETFQQRNTNRSIGDAFGIVERAQGLCETAGRELVVYLSMGFGNPYGDPYNHEYVFEFVDRLVDLGIEIISLADTVGVAKPDEISSIFTALIPKFPHVEFGGHLHATPAQVDEKVQALVSSGCKRIDGALRGFGGCPMAKDDLVGNLPTEKLIDILQRTEEFPLDVQALETSLAYSNEVFT